ncbi:chalcone isomerase family protein [Thalassolituus hydrocarboniclasticus]|uniref:Chalcone isomerase family protein n=1 Tax=Thalassolituus hydrocarboniclasticus TaxID=2742796 RepID=A0ABY6AB08_9GAMM|nr:chalcone isomerase family protein [Thalassolituus hydrocarboniclasticus]UXD87770.1 chalcone isomerase family protein [Thalassolituus hydrocarboniclasticus]
MVKLLFRNTLKRPLARILQPALLSAVIIFTPTTQARTIEGFDFPEVLPQTADHPELKLNGASVRTLYYLVDTYVGLLYVEAPSADASQIIEQESYKRIVYHILVNRVSGRRIATAMYDALQLNISSSEAEQMDERLDMLVTMFDSKLERGDAGYVDYVPGVGSRVVINDEVKGILPGKDLYDALLKIWIGEHPVSHQFKDEILGLTEQQHGNIAAD